MFKRCISVTRWRQPAKAPEDTADDCRRDAGRRGDLLAGPAPATQSLEYDQLIAILSPDLGPILSVRPAPQIGDTPSHNRSSGLTLFLMSTVETCVYRALLDKLHSSRG
jgi:hypothetical protein